MDIYICNLFYKKFKMIHFLKMSVNFYIDKSPCLPNRTFSNRRKFPIATWSKCGRLAACSCSGLQGYFSSLYVPNFPLPCLPFWVALHRPFGRARTVLLCCCLTWSQKASAITHKHSFAQLLFLLVPYTNLWYPAPPFHCALFFRPSFSSQGAVCEESTPWSGGTGREGSWANECLLAGNGWNFLGRTGECCLLHCKAGCRLARIWTERVEEIVRCGELGTNLITQDSQLMPQQGEPGLLL